VPFHRRIAALALWNSLSPNLAQANLPWSFPIFTKGNDLWDFSLVDPDNRRSVDYKRRQKMFESIRGLSSGTG